MSDTIDYIDLTVDSPTNKPLRLQNRNAENISNNTVRRRRRKHNLPKQPTSSSSLHDSVIEIPGENTCTSKEIRNVVQINNLSEDIGIYCTNDSSSKRLIALSCPICYEQLSSETKPMSTRCGHIFCAQCLEQTLRTAKKCPTCQRAVRFQNCTRLYF